MKIEKPSIPNGTRDFGPAKMLKRQYILNTIRNVFEKFGFQPLETPAMENLSVLTGKYGEEGDQLLYKILNSGDFMSKVQPDQLTEGSKSVTYKIAEKGLRYDLTVPFARYVVMNQNEITFPFRRYQIQPVWRADRPQKGRYREFYQCDADVVGTDSLLCEAEIVLMINEVMGRFGLSDFTIKLNNRKVLTSIAESIGATGKEAALCVAIDKIDKIGAEKVKEELMENGFSTEAVTKLDPIFSIRGSNAQKIHELESLLKDSATGSQGIAELKELFALLTNFGLSDHHVLLDITLARGLSYYTGTILEVKVNNSTISSSISGGGRYDNLTGFFGLEGMSGVGFSFGVDRLYDVMEDLELFPKEVHATTKVLLLNFGQQTLSHALRILSKLRQQNIKSEIFPDDAKIKKQMNYANKKGVPYVLIIGENEITEGKYQLKNMETGEQSALDFEGILAILKA
ncbi:MAG: histidine--tRNA ligase [Cyclobacteriaceae bacterium]|nr:histidine--tRNA ligase [Cyclobacteriaceae bacterium]